METCSVRLLLLSLVGLSVGITHVYSATTSRYHGSNTTRQHHSDTTTVTPGHTQSTTAPWWWWTSTFHHGHSQSTTSVHHAQTGDVRIVGSYVGRGRVEIYANGQWGTVCDDNFSDNAARVVCRQLGHNYYNPVAMANNNFPGGEQLPILLDGFFCSGYESRLIDCEGGTRFGVNDCHHDEDAGVDCYNIFSIVSGNTPLTSWPSNTFPSWLSTSATTYPEGSVRLVNGSHSASGRVEIYINGRWGTVCDDSFGPEDAMVVCRQLGWYSTVIVYPISDFGAGSGDIWMDDVDCTGFEGRLMDCRHSGTFGTHNCQHGEDVGIDCLGTTSTYSTDNYYRTNSTSTPSYWGQETSSNTPGGAVHGAAIQLTAYPQDVVTGTTSRLTLTCAPGYQDDLSRIMLIQINHDNNGTKAAVADIGSGQSARVVDGHYRTSASGYVPYETYQQTQAYLTVTIDQPTAGDSGKWECTLSGLTHSNLMTTETAATTVHVSSLENVVTELGELRHELETAESTIEYLRNNLLELQQAKGQGFTAFLINNYTATAGRLPFQRELVDTLGVFSNSQLYPPENGLYFVTLTVSVNQGHHVTVAIRQAGMTLLTVIASAGNGSDGQNSASAVVALQAGYQVDAEVIEFSPGAMLLSSPSTLLSGYRL